MLLPCSLSSSLLFAHHLTAMCRLRWRRLFHNHWSRCGITFFLELSRHQSELAHRRRS
jgi:hypothetical protein